MKAPEQVPRREFTVRSVLALLSGVAINVWGCGGGDDSPTGATPSPGPSPAPAPEPTSEVTGTVGSNHGHVAVVTAAQLEAGGEVTLDITGQADHPHTVTLTGSELDRIAAGTRVSKTSSVEVAHAHTVIFN